MSNIDQIKQEMKVIKAQYKAKMDELQLEQLAQCPIKLGDLLEIKDGTYGKPEVKVYLVSKLVFSLAKLPTIYGHKRLASGGLTFSHSESQLFLRGDETPARVGHLDDWQRFTARGIEA
jgi:hypothetical protein